MFSYLSRLLVCIILSCGLGLGPCAMRLEFEKQELELLSSYLLILNLLLVVSLFLCMLMMQETRSLHTACDQMDG